MTSTPTPQAPRWLILGLVALIVAWSVRNLILAPPMAWGDFPAWPLHPTAKWVASFVFLWQEVGMGHSFPSSVGLLVLAALAAALGDDPFRVSRVFYVALVPLLWGSVYLGLRPFVPSRTARAVAGLLFVYNPAVIGMFNSGSPGPLFAFATLPVVVLLAARALELPRLHFPLLAAIALAFALGFTFYFNFPFIVAPLVVGLVAVSIAGHPTWGHARRALLSVALVLGAVFVLTLPMTYGYVEAIWATRSVDELPQMRVGRSVPDLINDVAYTYDHLTPQNALRLTGNAGGSDHWLGYTSPDRWTNVVGITLPLLAFSAVVLARQQRHLVLGMAAVACIVLLFLVMTRAGATIEVFRRLPILFVYRNPGGLIVVVALAFSILSAFTIYAVEERLRAFLANSPSRRPIAGIAPSAIIVGLLLVYNFPLASGDFGIQDLRHGHVEIPRDYIDLGHWLEHRMGSSERVLVLPYTASTDSAAAAISARVAHRDAPSHPHPYLDSVIEGIADGDIRNAGQLLAPLNIRWVVVDLASRDEGELRVEGDWPRGSAQGWLDRLERQHDLVVERIGGDHVVLRSLLPAGDIDRIGSAIIVHTAHDLAPGTEWENRFEALTTTTLLPRYADRVPAPFLPNEIPQERAQVHVVAGERTDLQLGPEQTVLLAPPVVAIDPTTSRASFDVGRAGMVSIMVYTGDSSITMLVNGIPVDLSESLKGWSVAELDVAAQRHEVHIEGIDARDRARLLVVMASGGRDMMSPESSSTATMERTGGSWTATLPVHPATGPALIRKPDVAAWDVSVDGVSVSSHPTLYGNLAVFPPEGGSELALRIESQNLRYLVVVIAILSWIALAVVMILGWMRHRVRAVD